MKQSSPVHSKYQNGNPGCNDPVSFLTHPENFIKTHYHICVDCIQINGKNYAGDDITPHLSQTCTYNALISFVPCHNMRGPISGSVRVFCNIPCVHCHPPPFIIQCAGQPITMVSHGLVTSSWRHGVAG